jgi:hypothetical protein
MDYANADRFKFRAWHKEWDEMVYSRSGHGWFDKRGFSLWFFDVGFSYYPKDDGWIIMQSMDRRDKHGKLIYEGDIVRLADMTRTKRLCRTS